MVSVRRSMPPRANLERIEEPMLERFRYYQEGTNWKKFLWLKQEDTAKEDCKILEVPASTLLKIFKPPLLLQNRAEKKKI